MNYSTSVKDTLIKKSMTWISIDGSLYRIPKKILQENGNLILRRCYSFS